MFWYGKGMRVEFLFCFFVYYCVLNCFVKEELLWCGMYVN